MNENVPAPTAKNDLTTAQTIVVPPAKNALGLTEHQQDNLYAYGGIAILVCFGLYVLRRIYNSWTASNAGSTYNNRR